LAIQLEKRALVVEPSRDLRELICEILNAQHYRVDSVADASTIANADKYAVVIADVPFGETPMHYAHRLRVREHLVLMSACPEELEETSEFSSLAKPFDRITLVDTIARASA